MEELMVVANVAIIFGVVYKLFELFVGKKERMMLIEKLSSEVLAFRLFDAWLGIRTFSRILYRFGNM